MHNFIIEFKQALTPEFCDSLIAKFEQDSNKQPGRTGAGVDVTKKDSIDLFISEQPDWQNECTAINQSVTRAMIEYVKQYPMMLTGAISPSYVDPKTKQPKAFSHTDIQQLSEQQLLELIGAIYRLDAINMQKYFKGKGGYHHWHSEHYPHPTDPGQKSLHRVLLWLIYLNDIEEGGETDFFYQNAKVKPTKGSIVVAPCGFTHTHRGSIPVSSDKYVLASWVMYRPAGELYGQ
ncbi:2OG-Fe(II) oxygenase [Aliikangiella marina]|uniref:2OG-Fe(II) oxygenase n=1 Tax=Aliikangiella marina TaxID=1712262 RepID=A0A545T4T6_9GAMM|nr:2OG-Fe(II) oxygenase [Aliikangiella marina]TQV72234.1 2OG-Fe(II) oxygenase [Aliikangiella marina]